MKSKIDIFNNDGFVLERDAKIKDQSFQKGEVQSNDWLWFQKKMERVRLWQKCYLYKLALGLLISLSLANSLYAQNKDAPANVTPGAWVKIGPTGYGLPGALIYSPTRKQMLRWGTTGNPNSGAASNDLGVFDSQSRTWASDYEADKANVGGNFYGGQEYAGWITTSNRPSPFLLFRQACWDSKRQRMVIAAHNITAAYDPVKKEWNDLKAAWEGSDGKRIEGYAPDKYRGGWFAPVPGQWGSMCYDATNDEYVIFPLWVSRTRQHWRRPDLARAPLPLEAGVEVGHFGTLTYNPQTNTWSAPELGNKEILLVRKDLSAVIDAQRIAGASGWKALIANRQEQVPDAVKEMKVTLELQKKIIDILTNEHKKWTALESSLPKLEARQMKDAIASLDHILARGDKILTGLTSSKATDLPVICAQQQALYRELRLILHDDLYVQPIPRCSTSVVYDSKNHCIVMAGGSHLDRLLSDTWVYDCKTRRWQRRAAAPEAADWPGMCFDSKRGVVLYAANNGTYTYDASRDQWAKISAGRPKGAYCDMAYDEGRDVYILTVANNKYGNDEIAFEMSPTQGQVITNVAAAREVVDDRPFPPPADPAVLERWKNLPTNTWTLAKPPQEVTGRSWSTMSWDTALRCVIYQGGGHGGTMDNTISAYFPESNLWVNAFPSQYPPAIFGYWSDAGTMPSFERGVGLSFHARWYESYAGRMVHGGQTGFEWVTREKPLQPLAHVIGAKYPDMPGPSCLHPTKPLLVGVGRGKDSGPLILSELHLGNLITGEVKMHKLQGAIPSINTEWSGLAVHAERNLLILHGAGDSKKQQDNETWVLDLSKPVAWEKLETGEGAPRCGMAKLSYIPGTPYMVLASKNYEDLWVFNVDKKVWKPLGSTYEKDAPKKMELYGQCVYAPETGVFIRKGDYSFPTLILRVDFSKIQWE